MKGIMMQKKWNGNVRYGGGGVGVSTAYLLYYTILYFGVINTTYY